MNSHAIKISGTFELPKGLELDHDYSIALEAQIMAVNKTSEQDGTFSYTYHAKPSTGQILSDKGEVTKLIDRKKQSSLLRSQLGFIAADRGIEPQEFYEKTMIDFRHNLLAILDFISSLDNH